MTRKSKQPGGHNPLTYHEQKRLKSSGYGTQSTRLTTESQLPFGHCCLNVSPITDDAVATPSGHIYSREAIVQYLLTKNGELKKQKLEYDQQLLGVERRKIEYDENRKKKEEERFVRKDQGALRDDVAIGGSGGAVGNLAMVAVGQGESALKKSSFWLASSQPIHIKNKSNEKVEGDDFDYEKELEALPQTPPDRPPSPMSGNPLKLKQLIPIHLEREGGSEKRKGSSAKNVSNTGRVQCSVSGKTITTQSVIAIRTSGQVMLRSVYEELAKPSMTCPVTGKKFKEKDVIELQKGSSGFAASGAKKVVAKKYNPTLT